MKEYSSNHRDMFPPLLARLKREERASLAVEMAILLPLIFALIFAVIDVSRLLLTRSLLDQLAQSLADDWRRDVPRGLRTTLTPADVEARLAAIVPLFGGEMIRAEGLTLTLAAYEDIAALMTANSAIPPVGVGAPGMLVGYRLDYDMPLLTPFADYLYPSGAARETVYLVVKNGA
ncbi:MAG: hypothetical protein CMN55_04200 [Sneathiella sp.]|jgi:hypothetical protein|uniref:TadE/TadG family type IV pilus assembly protein n=1 Tax=Sneathiella sp. TaxID=1964365 RepID=UPI000C62E6CB|nr:TadE/TadG family type IV pilus assembly protein [Sneathiella sp.]MAL78299.1 hypothetical protein [Sneathiella sp.]|tara:strand:- start:121 stop:648 length:528 start_codon:yes stop_codon:yes gene_type:complete